MKRRDMFTPSFKNFYDITVACAEEDNKSQCFICSFRNTTDNRLHQLSCKDCFFNYHLNTNAAHYCVDIKKTAAEWEEWAEEEI